MSEWQPIESAPQMRAVLVFYRNSLGKGRIALACYYRPLSLEMDEDHEECGEYDDARDAYFAPAGWYGEHQSDSPLMPPEERLTHWMPLPPPPPSLEERSE